MKMTTFIPTPFQSACLALSALLSAAAEHLAAIETPLAVVTRILPQGQTSPTTSRITFSHRMYNIFDLQGQAHGLSPTFGETGVSFKQKAQKQ